MTATAPDLWKKREHKSGVARREPKAEMPCHDRACVTRKTRRSANADGAEN